jgi:3-phosphoshikimate 1-carboxyvinyltransferase
LPVASAQVKSALLLAGLYADGETVVEQPHPTRDHTERMLRAMGADVSFGEGSAVRIAPQQRELDPLPLSVPGDISSAAPWLVLGALHPDAEVRLQGVGVNPTRTGIIDALSMMGADIRLEEERTWGAEPVADIVVRSSRLRGAVIEGAMVPRLIDEIPLVALVGTLAEGETVIRDASELRVKESDRIRTTAAGLRRMGARINEKTDGMRIEGVHQLAGTSVSSYGDHRLAVMLGIAGMLAQGETVVRNSSVVGVSYPRFWHDLRRASGLD